MKRNSYDSKSILTVLPVNSIVEQSKLNRKHHLIRSILFLLLIIYSLWSIPFYFILGLSYHFESAILLQDLRSRRLRDYSDVDLFRQEISIQYRQLKFNCFVSMFLYTVVLLISFWILRDKHKLTEIRNNETIR